MRDNWKKNASFSLQSFYSCNQHRRLKPLSRCVEPLIEKCRQSDIVAVKAIRLHMSYMDQLLSGDPDLRLIHLVRDPRGIVESQRKIDPRKSRSMTDMRLNAERTCKQMLTDCRIRRQLELKYPRRILLLRYEDLVTATDTVINDVYRGLLQLAFPSNISGIIREQLHASSANGPFETRRTNGTLTATNWRRTIDSNLHEYITDTCYELLDELRYN